MKPSSLAGRIWIATSKCTVSALDRAVFDTHHHIYKFLGAVFSLDREMAPQEIFQTNASHKLVEVEYLALPVPS